MSIKSKNVKLSIIPARVPRIMEVGRENSMQNTDGSLKLTSVCMKIINFVLELHADADIRAYLRRNKGETLLGLVRRGVYRVISEG